MDEYQNYIELKGWHTLFDYTKADEWQYNTIFKGVTFKGKNVCEVGFGSGGLMQYLKDNGAEVYGVEIQQRLLDAAADKNFHALDNLRDYSDKAFDIIVALDVIEHLTRSDLVTFLKEVEKKLTRNGILILRFPNCQSPAALYNQFGDHTHIQMLSVPILANYITETPFQITGVRTGRSNAEYQPNIFTRSIKYCIKTICEKLVKIALGYSSNTLAANVVVYLQMKK